MEPRIVTASGPPAQFCVSVSKFLSMEKFVPNLMLLDHKNMRGILRSLDKSKIVEIFCNRNLHSTCSLFIFTQILKKELLKYQIEFGNLGSSRDLYFKVGDEEFVLPSDNKYCDCAQKEVVGTVILYNVAKSMDFLRVETVWPVAVCYTFYRIFTKLRNPPDSSGDLADKAIGVCSRCLDLQKDLMFSVRTLNCKFEGMLCGLRNKLDFLTGSTLFLAIKNNLEFILDRKLFYTRGTGCDRKINEFLARSGISIRAANDQYMSLDSATKALATHTFGEESKFIMKSGHDIEISAIEHAFLIYFYLYKEKDMYAYMCLQKRKLMDFEKSCKFYHKVISLFREAAITASKAESVVFFQIKAGELSLEQRNVISDILLYLLRIYLQQRSMEDHGIVLSHTLDGATHQILYSRDYNLECVDPKLREIIGPNTIKVCTKELGLVLKQLIH